MTWLSIIIITIVFSIVFTLSSINSSIVYYCVALSSFILMIAFMIDFYRYFQKHQTLQRMLQHVNISIEELPKVKDSIEKDYQELIQSLFITMQTHAFTSDNRYQELLEYYTLWAHQIKTPIAAMKLLLQTGDIDSSDALLELAKIEQYVEMVLQYLRMQTMSNDLTLKKYSLYDIIKEVIKKQSHFFIKRNIHLHLEDFTIQIITDEKWLSFVIEQILSNALKYTSKNGNIHIYVTLPSTLIIQDDGMGIQEEDLPRVFEKGFTGYNGRMDKKSTGIGLYLCKQILDNLSHKITITSTLNKGTIVAINFETTDTIFE